MWSNFHTHSNYCDGKGTMSDYVTSAEGLNMHSLGFSSHAPLPFPCNWCMNAADLAHYFAEIDRLKAEHRSIEIYKSLEIDFIPGVISPRDFSTALDYTIGSIHFVEQLEDGRRWEIDGLHTFFLEGLENIFRNDIKAAITRYFELTRQMIDTAAPSVVGHLDKIKIQNIDNKLFREEDAWYRQEVIKTIETIEGNGCVVEVNTRGLYKKKSATTYPSPWILELLHEKNIPVTINSDAHNPADLTARFSETAMMLKALGFRNIFQLHAGSWRAFTFNEYGIIIS